MSWMYEAINCVVGCMRSLIITWMYEAISDVVDM